MEGRTEETNMAHQLADIAEAAYQRGTLFPKRIKLMAEWTDQCLQLCALFQSLSFSVDGMRTDILLMCGQTAGPRQFGSAALANMFWPSRASFIPRLTTSLSPLMKATWCGDGESPARAVIGGP
jgi:hypothetical protein